MIRTRLQAAQSRQKNYTDNGRRDLEFVAGDHVFLGVASMKGIMRFEKKGKLSPKYIGPFEIVEKISLIAYRVTLQLALSSIHDVFHVSMLRKYVPNPSQIIIMSHCKLKKICHMKKLQFRFWIVRSRHYAPR